MTHRSARERRTEKSALIEELQRSAEELTTRNADTEAMNFETLPRLGKGDTFWPAAGKTERLPTLSSQTSSATDSRRGDGWVLASPGEIFSPTMHLTVVSASGAVPSAEKKNSLGPRLGINFSSIIDEVDENRSVISPQASPKQAPSSKFPPALYLHPEHVLLSETAHPPKGLSLKIRLKPRPEATLHCPVPQSPTNQYESSAPAPSSQWHFDPEEIDRLSKLTSPSMESAVEVPPKIESPSFGFHKGHAMDTNGSFLQTDTNGHRTHASQLADPIYFNNLPESQVEILLEKINATHISSKEPLTPATPNKAAGRGKLSDLIHDGHHYYMRYHSSVSNKNSICHCALEA